RRLTALSQRLLSLWDHLGIGVAHVATQMPGDIADLVARFPARVGGVALCAPTRLDPLPFEPIAGRLLLVSGEHGLTPEVTERAAERLPGARRHVLSGYNATGWADVAAERTDEIVQQMTAFLGALKADGPAAARREGSHAGISWRIEGSGPA